VPWVSYGGQETSFDWLAHLVQFENSGVQYQTVAHVLDVKTYIASILGKSLTDTGYRSR
jgi:hypothetical protein